MQALLKRAWWALLVGGVASVIFGVLAFMWPGLTLFILAVFFRGHGPRRRGRHAGERGQEPGDGQPLVGLAAARGPRIVAGAIGLLSPSTAAGALLLLISAYAIAAGVLMIWAGIKLRAEIEREWLLWLMGGVSVLFGLLMVAQPAAGLMGFVWVIASWAIAEGVLKIMLAFKARSSSRAWHRPAP